MTAVEVCALAPTKHGQDALRLSTPTVLGLCSSFIHLAGPDAVAKCSGGNWVDPSFNPMDHPDLQALISPVLRELLVLLVPLLLPECHDIPLPASAGADPTGSKLSAMLPQQVFLLAAAGVCWLLVD